ncbi:MAG: hypothetical protein CFE44_13700 [Burkholderiales bacterium PBB4]|nr:MAG: hypothetical protein CFE44_13700 [Burkholderiales bacterium PBB4]
MTIRFPIPVSAFCAMALLGAAVTAPAHAKITRTVDKTFAVQAGGKLNAETQGGNITVKTEDANEVRIVATQVIDAATDDAANKLLEKLTLSLEQKGNEVSAIASYERPVTKMWGNTPVTVSYTITVPRQFNLQLKTSGGDIRVASVKGVVNARTSGGNLVFERVDGELEGKTSGGNVSLKEGTARVLLSTSGGNMEIDRAGGPVTASTSGGDIKIQSATEVISATTSGGNISARLTEPLQQDSVLRTSGGNVTVVVPRTTGFMLVASRCAPAGEMSASRQTKPKPGVALYRPM